MDAFNEDDDIEQINYFVKEKTQKRLIEFEEDDELFLHLMLAQYPTYRDPSYFRKRWDSSYLVKLANKEKSFVA